MQRALLSGAFFFQVMEGHARTIYVRECTWFSIGGYCVIDTLFFGIVAVVILSALSIPLMFIRRSVSRGVEKLGSVGQRLIPEAGDAPQVGNREKNVSAELQKQMNECVNSIQQKWRFFQDTFKFKSEVTLANQIDMFAAPIEEFVRGHYPAFLSRPGFFHLLLFTAILESGTHSRNDVNGAITILRSKYSKAD